MSIGTNLRKLRAKTKFSQRDVADLLGVDKNTYANWESNTCDIKSIFIPKLASIFEVEIKVLFDKETTKKIENNLNNNIQIHKDYFKNNTVILFMPDRESVDKFVAIMKERFEV